MTKTHTDWARWVLSTSYLDADGRLCTADDEVHETRDAVESRMTRIQRDGLTLDVTAALAQEHERIRAKFPDDYEAPSGRPAFAWYPPHRIVECFYYPSRKPPREG